MNGVSKPRGEYAKSAERREMILRAGVEVFARSGFRSGSLREVADRVGMSQAGLLHHFPSKTDLLEAVLSRRDDDAFLRIGGEAAQGLGFLRGLVDVVAYNESTPGLVAMYCVLSAEATSPDHPAHDYFQRRYRYVYEATAKAFEVAKERGELRRGVEPLAAARGLIALMDGLQLQWLLDPDSVQMQETVLRYTESLLAVPLPPPDMSPQPASATSAKTSAETTPETNAPAA